MAVKKQVNRFKRRQGRQWVGVFKKEDASLQAPEAPSGKEPAVEEACGAPEILEKDGGCHSGPLDQASKNLDAVEEFYSKEEDKKSYWQRLSESMSYRMGRPAFMGGVLLCSLIWGAGNMGMAYYGLEPLDPAPFFILQGWIGFAALATSAVVLTRQNRLGKLEEQRARLELKVALLTEQKVAKLISLVEELRRDLPNVKNRNDPEAEALIESMGPGHVQAVLGEQLVHGKKAVGIGEKLARKLTGLDAEAQGQRAEWAAANREED